MRVRAAVLPLALGGCLAVVSAQNPIPPADQTPIFRATTALTLVRFQVIRSGQYIGGISSADVRVLDNGVERPVEFFEGGCGAARTLQIEIAILFDLSGSVMDRRLIDWPAYRDTFLTALASARLSVYGFSSTLYRFCNPTRDQEQLRDALGRVQRSTETSAVGAVAIPLTLPPKQSAHPVWMSWIYESTLAAAKDATERDATRVVVVVSDGQSSTTTSVETVADEIQALGVSVFPIILGSDGSDLDRREFARLGELTGGRSFQPLAIDTGMVRRILAVVAETIRCEYVVGVTPRPTTDAPVRHAIEVRLRSTALGELRGGRRSVRY
jgi:VWFA-related protein